MPYIGLPPGKKFERCMDKQQLDHVIVLERMGASAESGLSAMPHTKDGNGECLGFPRIALNFELRETPAKIHPICC